jgi:predicted nucleotidyltransferase component of viral defense system
MKNSPYFKQAQLMLRIIPHVAAENCFALKGGTAINLFLRDMPRLSVDIDLTYLPLEPRQTALQNMESALERIAEAVRSTVPRATVQASRSRGAPHISKLFVRTAEASIKIEPNQVLRGAIFPSQERELSAAAEALFELSVTARTLSVADLYGGKLCAALDRQHPRDLFDIKLLLEDQGITHDIRRAFVIYLASHERPMHELLNPRRKDVRRIYENEFVGMMTDPVDYDALVETREAMIDILRQTLTEKEKRFLVSLKQGQPEWELMAIDGIELLPAIQWKWMNIRKMKKQKHTEALEKLRIVLGI